MSLPYANLFQRLLANSRESEEHSYEGTPCWEWTGRVRGVYPYMSVRVPGKKNPQGYRAHRVIAELVVGRELHPVLETIEHACSIPWCINVLHFCLAHNADNTADMRARINGKPRKVFEPLIDPARFDVDRLMRTMPMLKSDVCPF